MATKFYDVPGSRQKPTQERKTVFTHCINTGPILESSNAGPQDWLYVQYLFTDFLGYDHFKAWDTEGACAHYIGIRGGEYYEPC